MNLPVAASMLKNHYSAILPTPSASFGLPVQRYLSVRCFDLDRIPLVS